MSDSSPFAPLGPEVDTSGQTCTRASSDGPANLCGAPATWHIAWDLNLENGLACDTHMAEARTQLVFVDRHPVGPDCSMPGVHWDFDHKRCVYPDDPAPAEERAVEPQPQEAACAPTSSTCSSGSTSTPT